jgi:hypothetical protein
VAVLASQILVGVKPLLNDPQGLVYSDQALLPLLNKAYRELQIRLARAGMGPTKEVADRVPVFAGITFLGDGSGLPAGLLYPIELREGPMNGPISDFVGMEERNWEPTFQQTDQLRVWAWREEQLKFPGATTNRDVYIRFMKGLTAIDNVNVPIQILNSELFLESRTASIAAAVLGENYTRASTLNSDAEMWYDTLVGTLTKRGQRTPVRRMRTRYRT